MRGWFASFTASHAASISPLAQRASEATVQFVTAAAMACTLLWSIGDAMAKPASITSTPSFSSWPGHFDLFRQIHAAAGGLLAVSQSRVKNFNAFHGVFLLLFFLSHSNKKSLRLFP